MFSIKVTLDGCGVPMELCRCTSPEAVASVVLALCKSTDSRPLTVQREPTSLPPLPEVTDEP